MPLGLCKAVHDSSFPSNDSDSLFNDSISCPRRSQIRIIFSDTDRT